MAINRSGKLESLRERGVLDNAIVKLANKVYQNSPLMPDYNYSLYFLTRLHLGEVLHFQDKRSIKHFQDQQFKALVKHAYDNVPFYRRWFKEQGLYLADIKSTGDISKFPLMNKKTINKHFHELVAMDLNKYLPKRAMTSGSTSVPFRFYQDRKTRIAEKAAYWKVWHQMGIPLNGKMSMLRGTLVYDYARTHDIYWKYGSFDKTLHFNTFNMNRHTAARIIQEMNRFKPHVLIAFPSSMVTFVKFIGDYHFQDYLKAITYSSESFSREERAWIQSHFECPVLDRYGQTELVASAFECKPNNGYHFDVENNIIEVLDDKNEQVGENERGHVVGTSLVNKSMPFIRYTTEDVVYLGTDDCDCGRHSRKLKSIEGRILDYLINGYGSLVSGTTFYHYYKRIVAERAPHADSIQMVQPAPGKLVIQILPGEKFTKDEEKIIHDEVKKFVGDMDIEIEYLDKSFNPRKWRFMISKLNIDDILKNAHFKDKST